MFWEALILELDKKTIHWCGECQTPIILEGKRGVCSLCGAATRHMCVDIRPVFPEERLLVEILLQNPFEFLEQNVWASTRGRYYVDGKSVLVPQEQYSYKNAEFVRAALAEHSPKNSDKNFKASVDRFIKANAAHLSVIELEAMEFTRKAVEDCSTENIVISFSGGKDNGKKIKM